MEAHALPNIDNYIGKLNKAISGTGSQNDLYKAIVNAPFKSRIDATMLDLGIVVLLLANKKTKLIDRVALSNTQPAHGAVNISDKRFEDIKIPLNHKENIIAEAIRTGNHIETVDWKYLFTPDLSPRSARFNQAAAGIDCSVVYPLKGFKSGGALIFSYFQPLPKINSAHHEFMNSYSTVVGEALKKFKK